MPAQDDRDRIRGALLGLAVGDALGAPLEGPTPDAAARVAGRRLKMTGGLGWAPGEWTDYTAMALALAERSPHRVCSTPTTSPPLHRMGHHRRQRASAPRRRRR